MKKEGRLKFNKKVKGLSPVVATIFLIAITVAIALIVFLWVRGMTQESITKFGNQNIQLVCNQVSFEASYTPATGLYIRNPGTVPIFGMNVEEVFPGGHKTMDLRQNPEWPTVGLNEGGIFSDESFQEKLDSGVTQIVLIPVLIGESKTGRKTYVCDEKQYGYSITI